MAPGVHRLPPGSFSEIYQKNCRFFTKEEHPAPKETEVLYEKWKTVLPMLQSPADGARRPSFSFSFFFLSFVLCFFLLLLLFSLFFSYLLYFFFHLLPFIFYLLLYVLSFPLKKNRKVNWTSKHFKILQCFTQKKRPVSQLPQFCPSTLLVKFAFYLLLF